MTTDEFDWSTQCDAMDRRGRRPSARDAVLFVGAATALALSGGVGEIGPLVGAVAFALAICAVVLLRWSSSGELSLVDLIVSFTAAAYLPRLAVLSSRTSELPSAFGHFAGQDLAIALCSLVLGFVVTTIFATGVAGRGGGEGASLGASLVVAGVLLLSTVAAANDGSLSARASDISRFARTSEMSLLFEDALLAAWMLCERAGAGGRLSPRFIQVLLFALSLLRQVRRLSAFLLCLSILWALRRGKRSARMVLAAVVGAFATLAVAQAWRASVEELVTANLAERMMDAAERLARPGERGETDEIGRRLTYAAFDASCASIAADGLAEHDAVAALSARLEWSVPQRLLMEKKSGWDGSCERTLQAFMDADDLPCTMNAEILLSKSVAVFFLGYAALGVVIGFASRAVFSRRSAWVMVGAAVLAHLYHVETGVSWIVGCLRETLLWLPAVSVALLLDRIVLSLSSTRKSGCG